MNTASGVFTVVQYQSDGPASVTTTAARCPKPLWQRVLLGQAMCGSKLYYSDKYVGFRSIASDNFFSVMWKHSWRKVCLKINAGNRGETWLVTVEDKNFNLRKGQARRRGKIGLIHVFISSVCFPQRFTVFSKYTNATPCKAIQSSRFLGASQSYVKQVLASSDLSIRPSTRPHGTTRFPKDAYSLNFTLLLLFKSVKNIQVWFKAGKNITHFT